jgi:hypothetical protein
VLRFGARFDAGDLGVQEDIIKFAAGKLLNADTLVQPLTEDQALACLAQRLPIEFLSTNYVTRDVERKQVEGHMRVCLKIDAAFESMVTVSASEPILSEAAYFIMARPSFNAPVHLKSVLDGFSVHKGERGELVALLLLTLARDATVGPPGSDGRPNSRIFNMASFVSGHLFTASTSSPGLDLASAKALKALRKDFPHAVMHFNHFIKLHDFKSVDMKSLLFRMTRGAGVLCANSQYAVDVIQTFLCSGTTLCLDNGGLILSQIKLDSNYTHIPQWDLFSAMDLYNIGILKDGDPAVPVIRIIFSLAARTPGLTVVRHPPSSTYDAITYDIWCAGLSHDILGPVDKLYSHVWDALLQASYGWKELYKGSADKTGDLRRSMNPGAAMDAGHWSRWTQRN